MTKRRISRKARTITAIPSGTHVVIKAGAKSQLDQHAFNVDTIARTDGVNQTYNAWIAVKVGDAIWSYHQADLIFGK